MHVLAYKDFLFFFKVIKERPKIKYIKSLPKSTHGKDVIFDHKKWRISAHFNVTDGMPYTDYLSRETIKVSSRYELKYQ
jgi:hypothetical protein